MVLASSSSTMLPSAPLGASLTPLMVTVTLALATPPAPSLIS